jgi:DNA mismatch repair protein Mlh1 C-terminus
MYLIFNGVRRPDRPCFGREELFYQLGLRQFGNFPKLKLDPPAPLRPLLTLAVDAEQNTELSNLSKPQIVDVSELLIIRLSTRLNHPRSLFFAIVDRAYPYLSKRDAKGVLLAGYHNRRDGRLPSRADPGLYPELGQTSAFLHATWPTGERAVTSRLVER